MRSLILLAFLAAPAFAEEKTTADPAIPGPVNVSVSYSLNLPVDAGASEGDEAMERAHRKAMYSKAARECEDLLASIAKTCQITSISMTTQFNRYPGQPATLYVSGSVSMQVALKD